MRILFLGAGALGGYFGGRLTAGGADVTLLVRENRQKQLAKGVSIQSPVGDAVVQVKTITSDDDAPPFDVIVLTNKAYGLDGALDAIQPYIGAGTVIIPLLNGIAHYEIIEARLAGTPVLGGVAHIPAEMLPDGTILHRGDLQRLTVGPRPGQECLRPQAETFIETAKAGGVDARVSDTIEQVFWDKWVMLTSLAAATCLMRADVGAINRTDKGSDLIAGLIDECSMVAAAEGHALDTATSGVVREQLITRDGDFKASMLTDLEAGNPTEADHILGDMIRRAEVQGIATPLLDVAMSHLQVYEASRAQ